MLKLKRVELQGFKSFCDRTELRFNGGGIAAVVGPNGCGKSNLSDAISWVLGEQSAKSLRGARMEDVIFAGTRDRKPLGLAAVTMTLVDPLLYQETHEIAAGAGAGVTATNGHTPHPHVGPIPITAAQAKNGEITITRRLFRSGESEYLINGHTARLRDIQDIFMGTGLGPESYAIIEQGRIGQILSSKPQDRRSVIEEAAGITKFKTRKRLAEAKLEGAKQNLARVFDILEEVTRQVNSLKRQAAKARRYGELKTEMDARLRVALSGKFRMAEREAAKAALDLNLASADLRGLSEQVSRKELAHTELQGQAYQNEQQLTETRRELAECQVETERTRGRLESQVKESGAIEQRIAQADRESQELEVRLGRIGADLDAHQQQVAALDQQIGESRARMLEKNRLREELQATVREREQAIEQSRTAVLRLLGEVSTLRNQLAQMNEYLAGIERETARVQKEEQTSAAELERLAAARKALSETDGAAPAGTGIRGRRAAAHRRRIERAAAGCRGGARPHRSIAHGMLADEGAQGIARAGAGAPQLHHRIGEAPVRRARKGQGAGPAAAGRAGRLRGSGPAVRKARRGIPARRAGIRGGRELVAGRPRPGFPARRARRPRHVPGASGEERQRQRASAGAGHRAGNRHSVAAQRFAAPHQRADRSRRHAAAARLAVLRGRGPRRRPNGWPPAIRISTS